ncbi:thiosulfate oxidation carrier complex protein SoxZ [Piscinibacter sakaiensis]|uniref:thiosulfate oxidation carrier complex protein SoxZ n=1 Tax=Piscinibacter sakaiensis TaxID=1547922 RepID=UPI003AAD7C1B
MARSVIHMPATAKPGDIIAVRVLVQHPMETGHRSSSRGERLPRDIIRRVECRFEGELVFAADLYPAIAANPTLAFFMRATRSGTLRVEWRGDNGFVHADSARLQLG